MNLIYLIAVFPLISFFLLLLLQKFLSKKYVSIISVFFLLISAMLFLYVLYDYCSLHHVSKIFFIPVLNWITINNYTIQLNCLVDIFSLSMSGAVILISLSVYFFSLWYMHDSEVYTRFFIYMNLFVSFMIFFLLTTNLISMFFAWEIIGICSYLLIGFYSDNKKNAYFATKSFLMTRIGDIFFLMSIFLIFLKFHTLDFFVIKFYIKEIIFLNHYSNELFWISCCLIIAAAGKSAQVPLHTWLIGAMSGPTPASALIHSATMVTMGIYLIIRTYPLFCYNSCSMLILSLIGCITILLSSISAVFEENIKCILAFSTMSQIGYMFLALGTKNIYGAFFHLIGHAFFKSLLFLSAGSIIKHLNGEQNIFRMGRLYKRFPFIYATFLIGSMSLISLPYLTSTYYSKENILFHLMYRKEYFFLSCSFLGVFLTSLYLFRMIFLIFHGVNKPSVIFIQKNLLYYISFVFLCAGCTPIIQYIFSQYLSKFFYISSISHIQKLYIEYFSIVCLLMGFLLISFFYMKKNFFLKISVLKKMFYKLYIFIVNYWFFDAFYSYLFINTYVNVSKYLNSQRLFCIENDFLNNFSFLKKNMFKSDSVNIICHIQWYMFFLTAVLLTIFVKKNFDI